MTVRVGIVDSGINPDHPHVGRVMSGVLARLEGAIGVDADAECDRETCRFRNGIFLASPYPRPIPGVPREFNPPRNQFRHRELRRIACSCHGKLGVCPGASPNFPGSLRVRAHVSDSGTPLRCSVGGRTMSSLFSETPVWNPTRVLVHPIDKTRGRRRGGA